MIRMLGVILSTKEGPGCPQRGVTKSGRSIVRSLQLHCGNKLGEKQETVVKPSCGKRGKGKWVLGITEMDKSAAASRRGWSRGLDAGGRSLCARHMLSLFLSVQTSHSMSTNDLWKLFPCGMTA